MFLIQCKQNYFDEIIPGDQTAKPSKGYLILKGLAESYFAESNYEEFEQFFMEGQYLVQLWAAHLVLEYGDPTEELKNRSLEEIAKYSTSPLSTRIADLEANWLKCYHNEGRPDHLEN
jgi:hypothetical protein